MQHKNTKTFLHSHVDRYPLKYDDGRISSAGKNSSFKFLFCFLILRFVGQQVTGYAHNDTNNHWIVEPTKDIPETGRGRVVRQHDVITLRHINTNTTLLTHDVACTTMATNTEFTTWAPTVDVEVDGVITPGQESNSDTHFKIEIDDAHEGQQWMTKSSHFQLVHVNTKVAMWTHTDPLLPQWAYKQQEVNGNKKLTDRSTFWIVDEIIRNPGSSFFFLYTRLAGTDDLHYRRA